MGMYNMVLGDGNEGRRGSIILRMLDIKPEDVGRYRDSWFEMWPNEGDPFPVAAIYTRNGGGNREHWDTEAGEGGPACRCTGCIATYVMPAHPLYILDQDDEFDSTYATFYFRVPEQYDEAVREVASDKVNMSERWMDAIAALDRSVGSS